MEKSRIIKEVERVLNASKDRESTLYGAAIQEEAEIQLRALELLTDLTYPLL
jgi:hypothetical protein